MSASDIAGAHFRAAMVQADADGQDRDAVARCLVSLAIGAFLSRRPVGDVRQELTALADNLDPDADFVFMRP